MKEFGPEAQQATLKYLVTRSDRPNTGSDRPYSTLANGNTVYLAGGEIFTLGRNPAQSELIPTSRSSRSRRP